MDNFFCYRNFGPYFNYVTQKIDFFDPPPLPVMRPSRMHIPPPPHPLDCKWSITYADCSIHDFSGIIDPSQCCTTRFSFYKNILYKNIEDEMGQKVKNTLRICSSWTFAYKVKNTLSSVSFLSLHFHFYYYSLQNLLRCLKYICPCYSPFVSYIRLSNSFATSTLGTFTPVCL